MGYWNGESNFYEWAISYGYTKTCKHCRSIFYPKSGNQKFCSREDSPYCDDDRYYAKLWEKGKHPLQLNEDDKI